MSRNFDIDTHAVRVRAQDDCWLEISSLQCRVIIFIMFQALLYRTTLVLVGDIWTISNIEFSLDLVLMEGRFYVYAENSWNCLCRKIWGENWRQCVMWVSVESRHFWSAIVMRLRTYGKNNSWLMPRLFLLNFVSQHIGLSRFTHFLPQ